MLSGLLELGPGHTLALEVYGDVAATRTDRPVLVEEDKSSLSGNNPLSERAPQFWKTLRNWVDMARQGVVDPETARFRIFVLQRYEPADLVSQLGNAQNPADAHRALNAARARLLSDAIPTELPRLSSELAEHVRIVLDSPDALIIPLIVNLEIRTGEGSSIDILRHQLAASLIPPELIEDALIHLLGWVKASTDLQLERDQPARINFDEFQREATSYIRKLDRRSILTSFAPAPLPHQVEQHLKSGVYVRQLQIIEESYANQLQAVNDYLLAAADRAIWAKKGHVHRSSFDELENTLQRAWSNLRTRVEAQFGKSGETERGRVLFADCSLHRATVEGVEPPPHFVVGSFHALADALEIGWHPRYRELMADPSAGSEE